MGCSASMNLGRPDAKDLPPKIALSPVVKIGTDSEGRKTINEYALMKRLGEGSYGHVHLCVNTLTKQKFAMKIVERVSKRQQMNNEVLVLMKLHHLNITKLYEVIDDADHYELFLVFEYVCGGCVMSLGKEGRAIGDPMPETQAREYMKQIVAGLEYLHSKNIIHRDIKPDNILVTKDKCVKIGDFGVSQIMNSQDDSLRATQGTLMFYSPEACKGEGEFSGTLADIWALGITLYAFIYGVVPFNSNNQAKLFDDIKNKEITFPPTPKISDELQNLITRMLAKQMIRRITLNEVKDHPWLRGTLDLSIAKSMISPNGGVETAYPCRDDNAPGKAIMVVDDVYLGRRMTTHLLNEIVFQDDNHRVFISAVSDGEEAVESCKKKRYDLVLMDIHMGQVNGYEATARIRKIEAVSDLARSAIVGLTGDDDAHVPNISKEVGMDEVMRKPINPPQLMKVLTRYGFQIKSQAKQELTFQAADAYTKEYENYAREKLQQEAPNVPLTATTGSITGSNPLPVGAEIPNPSAQITAPPAPSSSNNSPNNAAATTGTATSTSAAQLPPVIPPGSGRKGSSSGGPPTSDPRPPLAKVPSAHQQHPTATTTTTGGTSTSQSSSSSSSPSSARGQPPLVAAAGAHVHPQHLQQPEALPQPTSIPDPMAGMLPSQIPITVHPPAVQVPPGTNLNPPPGGSSSICITTTTSSTIQVKTAGAPLQQASDTPIKQ